jgi:hypothetical protein
MWLDSVEISAIIGFLSVVAGISGYSVQNYYIKRGEKETREYQARRRQYEKFVKMIIDGIHIVQTRKGKTSLNFKKQLDEVTNPLYLYASGDVIRALKAYFANSELEQFQKLIFAMRNDINMKQDLTESEIEWFRAT